MLIKNKKFIMAFGAKVKELRLSQNMSQEGLANTADIPISQIGRIERGEINTTLITVKALADALGVKVDTFFKDI